MGRIFIVCPECDSWNLDVFEDEDGLPGVCCYDCGWNEYIVINIAMINAIEEAETLFDMSLSDDYDNRDYYKKDYLL